MNIGVIFIFNWIFFSGYSNKINQKKLKFICNNINKYIVLK